MDIKEYKAKYYQDNKERLDELSRRYVETNREAIRAYQAAYRAANKEKLAAYNKEYAKGRPLTAQARYRKANPDKHSYYTRARQLTKSKAMPKWLTEEQKQMIKEFYVEARRLTEETGILHHVDHIQPLRGRKSWGLHVPWNLQVIPAKENLKKSNKEPV